MSLTPPPRSWSTALQPGVANVYLFMINDVNLKNQKTRMYKSQVSDCSMLNVEVSKRSGVKTSFRNHVPSAGVKKQDLWLQVRFETRARWCFFLDVHRKVRLNVVMHI